MRRSSRLVTLAAALFMSVTRPAGADGDRLPCDPNGDQSANRRAFPMRVAGQGAVQVEAAAKARRIQEFAHKALRDGAFCPDLPRDIETAARNLADVQSTDDQLRLDLADSYRRVRALAIAAQTFAGQRGPGPLHMAPSEAIAAAIARVRRGADAERAARCDPAAGELATAAQVLSALGERPPLPEELDKHAARMREICSGSVGAGAGTAVAANPRALDQIVKEADCWLRVGGGESLVPEYEAALDRQRSIQKDGSQLLLDAEVRFAAWRDNALGRQKDAVPRLERAIAAFEEAHPDRGLYAAAASVAGAYAKLIDLEDATGDHAAAMRARAAFDRFAANARREAPVDAQAEAAEAQRWEIYRRYAPAVVAGKQMVRSLADARRRFIIGERETLRHDLEAAARVDPTSLLFLFELDVMAGARKAALAALRDAAEGTLSDLAALETMPGMRASDALSLVIWYSGLLEDDALTMSVAEQGPDAEAALALAFWLSEERKGRFFDDLILGRQSSQPPSVDVLTERAARAARFLRNLESAQATQVVAACLREPNHRGSITEAENKKFLTHFRGGVARSAYPNDSPEAFLRQLRVQLDPGESFVGYTQFGPANLRETRDPVSQILGKRRYAAFVVNSQRLSVFDLGDADEVDGLILRALDSRPAEAGDPPDGANLELWRQLYRRLWKPFAPLVGPGLVRIATDGQLQRLPFAALNDGRSWLFERLAISHVHSARDLVSPRALTGEGGTSLVFAEPLPAPMPGQTGRLAPARFPALPNVDSEVSAVTASLPGSELRKGAAADERSFQLVRAPRILHVATHGAFLSVGGGSEPAPGRRKGGRRGGRRGPRTKTG